jgi:hypothetical protein
VTLYRSVASADSPAEPAGAPRPIGVSLGHRELSEADHWILSQSPAPELACTHLVSTPFRHVGISLLSAATFDVAPELETAAAEAAAGQFGRAVIFPGFTALTGTLSVAAIVALSAIDKVEILGTGPADDDALVDTGGFVRPQYRNGSLVLTTTPAAGGRLVPFETRNPTPCCADHLS